MSFFIESPRIFPLLDNPTEYAIAVELEHDALCEVDPDFVAMQNEALDAATSKRERIDVRWKTYARIAELRGEGRILPFAQFQKMAADVALKPTPGDIEQVYGQFRSYFDRRINGHR